MSDAFDVVARTWSESAAYWEKHGSIRKAIFEPVTGALIAESGVKPNARERCDVLDVAAGTGDVTFGLARSLGPQSTVWSTDLAPGMVAVARREADRGADRNVRFCECAAENLAFASGVFDAVVCRFGIMFFRDPVGASREALRVARPGCRVAFAVWGPERANPFHYVIADVLGRYVSSPPADPDGPGAHRFAEGGKLVRVLVEAGAADVRERQLHFSISAPMPFDEFFVLRSELSDTLRDKLCRLSAGELSRLKDEVRENSLAYFSSAGFSFPAHVLIVSGVRER